jgi:hypothetical protein
VTGTQIGLLLAAMWAPPIAYRAGTALAEAWHVRCLRTAARAARKGRSA